ncbi:hypothetical protein DESUT3_34770 [Desulfuromonas versatilis]|uniref:PilN domain-containing protein n=1 Tax=Desulfuromonas versatilis TaxID=2802975 RepID=A0ABM8I067_9BACT|nr:PilN domain-containing protein [Desulfuromonas versatilis]BCR06408.1 hypothetical protein DESUT3_34770 [Desulfuromonas versatilis]
MKQQINLFQSAALEPRVMLSAPTMLGVLLGAVALLTIASLAFLAQANRLNDELGRIEQHQAEASRRLDEIQNQYPPRQESQLLKQQLARLTVEREAQRPLAALLQAGLEEPGGFSGHLEGLAGQSLAGVWLRRIELAGGGRQVSLAGSALNPELVPRLVGRLSEEPVFGGLEFSRFEIERSEQRPDAVDFLLSNQEVSR